MREIKLTQGKFALVDDDNFEYLNQFKWYAWKENYVYYALRHPPRDMKIQKTIRMHREILKLSDGDGIIVDHINRDGLDNRKCNLRRVSSQVNVINRGLRSTNKSGYVGVCWHKRVKKWSATLCFNGKKIHCGYSDDKILAAQKRDEFALKYFGEYATLNFRRNA